MNENIEKIVSRYNLVNGKNHDYTTQTIQTFCEKALENYSVDEIISVIDSNKGTTLFSVLDIRFIESKLNPTVQSENGTLTPRNDLTLGLIEQALATVIADKYTPKIVDDIKVTLDKYIIDTYGISKKQIKLYNPKTNKEVKGVTHEKLEEVLSFVQMNEPVMLVGSAGTGKNVICSQIAELLDLEFYFSNAITQEYKLTGFIDANGRYHETQFYKAFKNGGLFMLDEIDASIPETLIILNSAIANRYFDFPNEKVYAHENFRVISAGNTFGKGASYEYVGRNQLDGATLDRFAVIEIEYSETIENSLTSDKDLLSFVRAFRNACNQNGIQHIVSYRAITRLDKLVNVGLDIKEVLKTCLLKNLEMDDLRMIDNDMRKLKETNKYYGGFKQCI